ncbi:GMC oxidoreductase [Litoribrevibacter albus]|nr:GMC oxidoreductase [Litoribrevibacter albus]
MMKEEYDVVVIGSGFGGAITACRLAQAGNSVCILEKGRRWVKTEFPRSTGEVANHAFWDEKDKEEGRGFIEYLPFKNMDVIQGVGVGGGSLHYFNVHIQPPELIFDQARWPKAISKESLKPYYDVAKDMLAANKLTPPEGREVPKRTSAFIEAVAATSEQAEEIDICVHFSEEAKSPGGQEQGPCDYCGNCLLGCHVNAKNTLDLNYIPLAEKHGAEVYPLHQVVNILPHDGGYNVEFMELPEDPVSGTSVAGVVKGKKVVVSGGTLGSNQLLLECRDRTKSLPNLSDRLGKHFSGNGDFLFAGTHYKDKEIDAGRGPSITAGVGYTKGDSQHIYIEDLGFPDPFMWYLNGILPTTGRLWNVVDQAKNYLLRSLGLTSNFEAERIFNGGYMTKFLPYLGMGTDAADGKIYLDWRGRLKLDWKHKKSRAMFDDMIGHLKDISKKSGGHFINSPLWDWPSRKLLTAHPLGGCVMSDKKEDGVVNEWGEVWGYPGLYVADGSIVPSAISVNPTATISALSERVAFHMIHGREMEENDPDTPKNR